MFSQIESALDRAQGGLGIGLALVKGLVGLHGGTVDARSAGPGRGSTFTIHLPRDIVLDQPSQPAVILDFPSPKSGACRVLIADDNHDATDSLAMLIAANGHHICVAYSGNEAWQRAVDWHPDVLVLDIGMPGMNGYEVAGCVRQQSWGGQTLLLAATGWEQRDDKDRARAAGFDRHLTKPVNPDELLELIGQFALQRTGQRGFAPAPAHPA